MRNLKYDVVVVGGGAAGIAAAIGAKDAGASVILLEQDACFGGQATSSQVTAFCGFYTRGVKPDQAVFGVGELVLEKLRKYGVNTEGVISPSTGNASIRFDPEILKLVYDELLDEKDINALLHTKVVDVKKDGKQLKSIVCVDDEGWIEIEAKSFIDASGNANLIQMCEIDTEWGDDLGNVQQSSLSFRLENLPQTEILKSDLEKAIAKGKEAGIKNLEKETGMIIKIPSASYGYCTIPSVILKDLSALEMTRAEKELRKQMFAYVEVFRRFMPGFENIVIGSSGPKLGVREARRIYGEFQLLGDEIVRGTKRDDSIARGAWSPEMHRSNTALEYTHIPDNDYFSIPLGSLKVIHAQNLWASGRMICSDSLALGSVRVMGTAFATGHAAGVAAALTLDKDTYNLKEIQNELLRQNAKI